MRFAKWTFIAAGIYGLLVTLPGFFTEQQYSEQHPPAVTHPEYYYGFFGLCLAWQLAFLVIGSDPVRYRPLMPVAVIEKVGFVIAAPILYHLGRTPGIMVAAASMDALLGVLFVIAFFRTARATLASGVSAG